MLAPSSVQEMADLTMLAFDLADKYRMPAMLLADGTTGQMMEPVELMEAQAPVFTEKDWAVTGTKMQRKHHIVNSLYLDPEVLEKTVFERYERYKTVEKEEVRYESFMMEDAEYCVVAFGIAARVSKNAVVAARKEGRTVDAEYYRQVLKSMYPDWEYKPPSTIEAQVPSTSAEDAQAPNTNQP